MTETEQRQERADAGARRPAHSLETQILRGSGWIALGFGSRQIITWLSMLFLVRLLEPEAFGLVALALTVVSALQYLRGAGIWAALVFRRTDIEEAAASALVYLVLSSVAVYGVCFVTAPIFARVFHAPELTGVLRGLALMVFFGALGIVPGAILERELNYAAGARVDFAGALAQLSAIGLAFAGAGVWSLVVGQVAAVSAESAALWYLAPWRPSPRQASWSMLRELSRYGRFAGGANIATFVSSTVDTLAVGRILGATSTGFYAVAFRLATIPESVFGYLIVKAMFPAFSKVRDDREAFRRIFIGHAQRVTLLVLPVTIFITLAAEPIVLTLLGDEWSLVVTPVRILALFGFVSVLSATASAVFRGVGKPDLAMWFSSANVVLLVPTLILLTRWLELEGAALALVICLSVTTVPALVRTTTLSGVSSGELLGALWRPLACSAGVALVLAVLVPATGADRPVVSLVVLLVSGVATYLASAALFARSVVAPMWLDLRGTRT